jgi:hypothetical protein
VIAWRAAFAAVILISVAGCGSSAGSRSATLGPGVTRVSAMDPPNRGVGASFRQPAVLHSVGRTVEIVWIGPDCGGDEGLVPQDVRAQFEETRVIIELREPVCDSSNSSGNPRGLRIVLQYPIAGREILAIMRS